METDTQRMTVLYFQKILLLQKVAEEFPPSYVVKFSLSKINRSIGTRAESVRAPTTYEIPKEVVSEAIVTAVVHRDYVDNASVPAFRSCSLRTAWRFAIPAGFRRLLPLRN